MKKSLLEKYIILRDNQVPVVSRKDYDNIKNIIAKTNQDLKSKEYMPSTGFGYLGSEKAKGVTRFLPILSAVDTAIYYHICFVLSDIILKKRPRVFGGWHSVPKSQQVENEAEEEQAQSFLQDYFSDPFSAQLWLKEWRQFTDLITELCKTKGIGNYVIQTDVANFYDNIEIPKLVRNLRHDARGHEEYIEALELFLGYWNRRLHGYQATTKGIPQEVISDASRILAHYYLDEFDLQFSAYCEANDLINVRWADDMLIFGSSKKKLELAVHKASKILLSIGLNLNAAKTQIFSRSEFSKYRALDVLEAISTNDPIKYRRHLRASERWNKDNKMRIDTVFRASIGYIVKLGSGPIKSRDSQDA